jgi:sugar phosphate isomerase/epimerase
VSLSRRRFLNRSLLLPLGAALESRLATADPTARGPVPRVGGPKLKLSLNAYSFDGPLRERLESPDRGMSLLDVLEFCARHDFDAIDPTGYYFPGYPDAPSETYLNRFKRRAFELGLDISGTGARNDFATADRATRAAGVERVKRWIEVAARMGAPVLRVFAGPRPEGYTWEQAAAWMVDDLGRCVDHGERCGVIVGVQNHGGMLQSADEMLTIVRMVDSDWLGLIVDTGWFTSADPYDDIARVIPYAVNWQIKERLHGNEGAPTDLRRLARILHDSDYRGYIPIETLSVPGQVYDPQARVAELLQKLRAALAETATPR